MLGDKFLQRTWSSAKRWCSKSDSHEWHRSSVSRVQEGTGGWVRTSRVKNHAKNNSKSLFDALESKPFLFFVDIHSSLIDHVRRRSFIKFRLSLGNNIERTLNISLLLLYFLLLYFCEICRFYSSLYRLYVVVHSATILSTPYFVNLFLFDRLRKQVDIKGA